MGKKTTSVSCTALIPHGNILHSLMREQNSFLDSLCKTEIFFRFMPLCLFFKEDFLEAVRILQEGGAAAKTPLIIKKPARFCNIIMYPVEHEFGITEIFPDFLIKGESLCAVRGGIVTAFSPQRTKEMTPLPAMEFSERAVTVFQLCQIDFAVSDSFAWSWNIVKTKWFKIKKSTYPALKGRGMLFS
jgi:hypothetical protein